MNRTSTLTTLAVALALSVPVGTATWLSYGTYEPDTALDTADLMWHDAPGAIKNRIYFNGFTTWGNSGANGGWINPNVGAAQTNIDLTGSVDFEAILGVWTDCNRDGYVGMAETAVREYHSALLLDTSLCPPTSGNVAIWQGGNNYNGWVTELIPIGNGFTENGDRKLYRDPGALVWAEPGKPDDPWPDPGVQCLGRKRGDSQTTGGLLWQADCQGNGVALAAGARLPIVKTINDVDAVLGLGIGMGDDPANSDSPLNQPTFGGDESEKSAVFVQDCSAEPLLVTPDLPGDDLDDVVLLRPVPANPVSSDPTQATVPGTMNYTTESTWGGPGDPEGDCDTTNDDGQDFYGMLEGNPDVPPYNGKDAAWDNFRFQTASRGSIPANAVRSGASGASTDLGITQLGMECSSSQCLESTWMGDARTYVTPIVQTRSALNVDDPLASDIGADVANAQYYTFYAYTSSALDAFNLKAPGGSGVYGGPQCGDNDEGRHNGWNCDAYWWYRLADGSEVQPDPNAQISTYAKVHQPYNHRDVDCFDGNVGAAGIGVSPAFYGPNPCQR